MPGFSRRTHGRFGAVALAALALLISAPAYSDNNEPSHGYSVFGKLKYPPDFTHYTYVNPDAPKGGELRIGIVGSFDSVNQFIVKGTAAQGLDLTYQRLMAFAHDELGGHYGQIAESVTVAPDFSWVSYDIRPEARWHDGEPITVEDVIFSYEMTRDKFNPIWRGYMTEIIRAEKTGPRTVKFTFNRPNHNKLAYNIGGLTILPKHYWETRTFEDSTMTPPLGSGPYKVDHVEQGRTIVFERVKDYWAKDLAVNRGQYNFDTIIYDYYRDDNTEFEAFKAGELNFHIELTAPRWATRYNFDAVKDGDVIKDSFLLEDPSWILTYATNMRKERFKDIRVRKAIEHAFEFDWINKNFFHNLHVRIDSYFDNSPLGATGLPSQEELKLLEPWREAVPPEVFSETYSPHEGDGSGRNREGLRTALGLLKEAGWQVTDGKLTHEKTGEVFTLELLVNNDLMQRVSAPFMQNLRKLGIDASVRLVDSSQYFNRLSSFDYDMMVVWLPQASMPTRSLRDFWGSGAADRPGSLNFAGIEDPVVDALIEVIATSNDPEEYFAAIKAVDRVMLWNHYMLPMYTTPESWRAYRKELRFKPWDTPMYDYAFPASWWFEED